MDCMFCRIVGGDVPSMKVYEDDHALVFMDIAGDVDGHMVAMPKKHVESILDCDEQTLNCLMLAVKRVASHCIQKCCYEGVNLLNASGKSAGQSVSHFHVHIIPRKAGDGVDAWPAFDGVKTDIRKTYELLKMEEII